MIHDILEDEAKLPPTTSSNLASLDTTATPDTVMPYLKDPHMSHDKTEGVKAFLTGNKEGNGLLFLRAFCEGGGSRHRDIFNALMTYIYRQNEPIENVQGILSKFLATKEMRGRAREIFEDHETIAWWKQHHNG